MIDTGISAEPLDVSDALGSVQTAECGGVGLFVGTVRADNDGEPIVALDYDAHPELARTHIEAIAEETTSKWDVRRVYVRHRTGRCEIGEPTVIVACSAPHRADALEACRYIIDALKDRVPVWKAEIFAHDKRWTGVT
jgi:molybdopterin synthase catalytic subunit